MSRAACHITIFNHNNNTLQYHQDVSTSLSLSPLSWLNSNSGYQFAKICKYAKICTTCKPSGICTLGWLPSSGTSLVTSATDKKDSTVLCALSVPCTINSPPQTVIKYAKICINMQKYAKYAKYAKSRKICIIHVWLLRIEAGTQKSATTRPSECFRILRTCQRHLPGISGTPGMFDQKVLCFAWKICINMQNMHKYA